MSFTKTYTMRMDKKKYESAEKKGINLAQVCRDAIDTALGETECKECGAPLHKKKKKVKKKSDYEDLL